MNHSLYQNALLALAKSRQDDEPLRGEGIVRVALDNPLCGDSVALAARTESAGRIVRLAQQTRGCILCEAAAALMMQLTKDGGNAQLQTLCENAENMFRTRAEENSPFAVFAPVAARPARHECALLPFRALAKILAEFY